MISQLRVIVLAIALTGLFGCRSSQSHQSSIVQKGKFKVTILYPNGDGKTFDMDYYEKNHMPMVAGFIGKNLRSYEIDRGISGRTPNDKVPFLAIGYFYIDNVEEYNKAIAANRDKIIGDFKNYTNIQPMIQISEVIK